MQKSHEECGCIPWNYPQESDKISSICDGPGAYCFESMMRRGFADCNCPESCDKIQYLISDLNMLPINTDEECYQRTEFTTKNGMYSNRNAFTFTMNDISSMNSEKDFNFLLLVAQKLR